MSPNNPHEQNYPARGKTSEDRKYYTHTDGRVFKSSIVDCRDCDMADESGHAFCGPLCHNGWSRIEGAYVTTDEDHAACDMARQAIKRCDRFKRWYDEVEGGVFPHGCALCSDIKDRSCPARVYLAAKHQLDAWEVTP